MSPFCQGMSKYVLAYVELLKRNFCCCCCFFVNPKCFIENWLYFESDMVLIFMFKYSCSDVKFKYNQPSLQGLHLFQKFWGETEIAVIEILAIRCIWKWHFEEYYCCNDCRYKEDWLYVIVCDLFEPWKTYGKVQFRTVHNMCL